MFGLISQKKHDGIVKVLTDQLNRFSAELNSLSRTYGDVNLTRLRSEINKLIYQGHNRSDLEIVITYPENNIFHSILEGNYNLGARREFDDISFIIDNTVSRYFVRVKKK